ncbi:pyrimidine-nucleoside phosphorylase [Paenibacillus hamazuiensis]|uniref:pyrimidine-nucleoside phosphorylase n=1 Tax=Paenibacillus hamazuiensis TaxID=2936508 RepID=UPI00200E79CC|nr:pyrimidine-nucleoside phosphorylase [Paenibacillus hamazuiensis]
MRMVDLIQKKRSGQRLNEAEIDYVIQGYTKGEIPDYQMSALLMAICFQGMDDQETSDLTMAMVRSGDTIDLSAIRGIKVDKHSTGGVGDKVSLIVAPIVASLGVPVAKMSGRGLGHTGGTVDKLESIPGFNVQLSNGQFIDAVNSIGMAIVSQTGNLAPADKKIYALRDVTGTVDSIPLIASSIMSKKIASGANAIVLDVKVGSGAFMKTVDEARKLAETMTRIGKALNRRTVAIITDMDQPLGREIGNAGEVRESLDVLRGRGDKDLSEVSITVASYMALLGGVSASLEEARTAVIGAIESGRALETFKQFVASQGGNSAIVDDPSLLPAASVSAKVKATADGYVSKIEAEAIGVAAMLLGAGRATKEDEIDYAAGITLHKKIGDRVSAGDVLCIMHTNRSDTAEAERLILKAYELKDTAPEPAKLIHEIVEGDR